MGSLTKCCGGLLAAAALIAAAPTGATAAVTCTKYASPTGSDSAAGTSAAPYATLQKLADNLTAGQTGCLKAGTYNAQSQVWITSGGTSSAPVTIRSEPGVTAVVGARIIVEATASYITLEGLRLNGAVAPSGASPLVTISASGTVLTRNDISISTARSCISVGSTPASGTTGVTPVQPSAVRIERNKIHNCGVSTAYDHAIYLESTYATQVRLNWIYDNATLGVMQYPDSQGNLIERNVIDGNGRGVNFSGDVKQGVSRSSSNNVVRNNVVSNSGNGNVDSYWGNNIEGSGNRFDDNCLYGGIGDPGGIQPWDGGFTYSGNSTSINPVFVNRAAKDFRLPAGNGCRTLLGNEAADTVPGPDVTAPVTTISSGPTGTITTTSATFGFSSESGATFECQLDGGGWTACTSTKTYSALAPGAHTVAVRATDLAGNTESPPATRSFTVKAYAAVVQGHAGLVAYWRLGDPLASTTVADSKGSHTGTASNGTLFGRPSLITGDATTSAEFDGSDDTVLVPDAAALDVGSQVTLEGWIKPDALPAAGTLRTIMSKTASAYDLALYDSNGRASFTVTTSAGTQTLVAPTGTFAAGVKKHFAATYDGSTMRLYVNGAQVASKAQTGAIPGNAASVSLGSAWGTEVVDGIVDELALYNVAVPSADIANHYAHGA